MISGRISLVSGISPTARYRSAPALALFLAVTFCPDHAFAWVRSGSGSNSGLPCNAYYQSSLAFNSTADTIEFCDGSNWTNLLSTNAADDQIDLGTSAIATNPSVNGDLTTGLFSAATSTVSVATGGVQRMTVNSSGYVGIGTSLPVAALHVVGSSATTNTAVVAAYIDGRTSGAPATGEGVEVDFATKMTNTGVGYSLPVGYMTFVPAATDTTGGSFGSTFTLYEGAGFLGATNKAGVTYNAALTIKSTIGVNLGGMNLTSGVNSGVPITQWEIGGAAYNAIAYSIDASQRSTGSLFSSTSGAGIDFSITDAAAQARIGAIGAQSEGWVTTTEADLVFSPMHNNAITEKMRILGNGNVGIGTAAPAEPLEIYSSGPGVLLQLAGSSGTCNHTPGSSSETVSCSSDARLKESIADTLSALPWLSSIRVRDYTWKKTGQKRTGVIAQELQKAHPEMVTYDKAKDQWAVEQPNPWTLVKILQEQQGEIDDLKKQLASKH
jgi:hypothetical protein